jgi:hypothetical protein
VFIINFDLGAATNLLSIALANTLTIALESMLVALIKWATTLFV